MADERGTRPTFRVGDRVSLTIRPELKGVVMPHHGKEFLPTAVFVFWTEGYEAEKQDPAGVPYSGYNLVGESAVDRLGDLAR